MVATALVNRQLEEGRKLLERLDETATRIDVALWINTPDTDDWQLMLGTSGVNRNGTRKIYEFVLTILNQYAIDLSLSEISVVDQSNDLCKALRQLVQTGSGIKTMSFFGNFVNGQRLPDSIIYRVH